VTGLILLSPYFGCNVLAARNRAGATALIISPKQIAQFLTLVALLLGAISFAGQFAKHVLGYDSLLGLISLFNVESEGNLPTWFSAALLLICAQLLAVIAYAKQLAQARYRGHWLGLAVSFLYLSIDELARLHERLNGVVEAGLGITPQGFLLSPWVVAGGIVIVIFGLAYVGFLRGLPAKIRRLFLLSGSVYVGGALILETISMKLWDQFGQTSILYKLVTTAEESCEMLGAILFIYTLLTYISLYLPPIHVQVSQPQYRKAAASDPLTLNKNLYNDSLTRGPD